MAAPTILGSELLTLMRDKIEYDLATGDDAFVPDAEAYRYLDRHYDIVYSWKVAADPQRHTKSETITGDGSTQYWPLPSDYKSTVDVDRLDSAGYYTDLTRKYGVERNQFDSTEFSIPFGYQFSYQDVSGTEQPCLEMMPALKTGEVCRHLYIVQRDKITSDASTIPDDYGIPSYLAVSAAIDCMIKEDDQSKMQALRMEKMELKQEVKGALTMQSIQQGHRVTRRRRPRLDPFILRWKYPR